MQVDKKFKDLCKKLKALEDNGIGGEAENARAQLDRLLKEKGYSRADVFGNEITRVFTMSTLNESSSVLEKVIYSVAPEAKVYVVHTKRKIMDVEVEDKYFIDVKVVLDDAEYQEVLSKYRYFWKAYNEERRLLLSAFFNKHSRFFVPERPVTKGGHPVAAEKVADMQKLQANAPLLGAVEIKRMQIMMSALAERRYERLSRLLDD